MHVHAYDRIQGRTAPDVKRCQCRLLGPTRLACSSEASLFVFLSQGRGRRLPSLP